MEKSTWSFPRNCYQTAKRKEKKNFHRNDFCYEMRKNNYENGMIWIKDVEIL